MRTFKEKISVIMPAYNEGHHIYENLKETHKVFKRTKRDFEIVLVDDGSTDNTFVEAKKVAEEIGNIEVIKYNVNGGKGNALKDGFEHVSGEYVVFLDSDLDLHPEQLHRLFRIMRDEQAEVIIGSKHHPDSKLNYPMQRKIISRIYAMNLKVLFGLPLRDTQTGLKIFKYEVLEKVFPKVLCKRYAFDVELLTNAHRSGYKIAESPIVLDYRHPRKWGKMQFKDLYHTGVDTLAISYRMRVLKYYDRVQGERKNEDFINLKDIKQ